MFGGFMQVGHRTPPGAPFLIVLAVIHLFLLCATSVDAHSQRQPPLRRISSPDTYLAIVPRRQKPSLGLAPRYATPLPPPPPSLRHDDTLVLSLDVPDLLPFPVKLFVSQAEHMFHRDAKVSHRGVQETLRPDDYRLYTGSVIHPSYLDRLASLHSISAQPPQAERARLLGRASVMVHDPGNLYGEEPVWEGSFSLGAEVYNVMQRVNYERVKTSEDVEAQGFGKMVIFRQSDMRHDPGVNVTNKCSHDNLEYNSLSNPIFTAPAPARAAFPYLPSLDALGSLGGLLKRDDTGGMSSSSNFIDSINSTTGCPSTQKIVYFGVALDCNYISTYGSTNAARTQVLTDFNTASALYKETFNISLGIIELAVMNETCPDAAVEGEEWNVGCSDNVTLNDRLSLFSQWRGDKGDDGAGLWHLMSACPTSSQVGVAWLGTVCQTTATQQSGSTVSGTGISTTTKTEWSLIAHEVAHGFGAIHDCTSGCSLSDSCCPLSTSSCDADGEYIMNPTTSSTEVAFSGCTLGNICTNIGEGTVETGCLETPGGESVISLQQCGNGIVEDGEDCDPGGNSTSVCCNSSTCKFASSAVCDPANSLCCTSSCQLASSGTVCRAAVNSICDYAESCTGTSAECPDDEVADDGTSCGDSGQGLTCADGVCTSLDKQCSSAGGSLGLEEACGQKDDTSCVVSCKDPNSTDSCVVLQTPLVDGSSCGYGGHCYNSTCNPGSWQDTVKAWYKANLQIGIPVSIVVGLLALTILFFIGRCIYRASTKRKTQASLANTSDKYQQSTNYLDPMHQYQFPAAAAATRGPAQIDGTGQVPIGVTPWNHADSGPSTAPAQGYPAGRRMSSVSRYGNAPLLPARPGITGAGSGAGASSRSGSYPSEWGGELDPGGGADGARYVPGVGHGSGYPVSRTSSSSVYAGPGAGLPHGQGQGPHGWVDDRNWNGENFARQEAYGR